MKAIVKLNWNLELTYENPEDALTVAREVLEHSDTESIMIEIAKKSDPEESEVIEDESGDSETV